jgi:hypothetical protein
MKVASHEDHPTSTYCTDFNGHTRAEGCVHVTNRDSRSNPSPYKSHSLIPVQMQGVFRSPLTMSSPRKVISPLLPLEHSQRLQRKEGNSARERQPTTALNATTAAVISVQQLLLPWGNCFHHWATMRRRCTTVHLRLANVNYLCARGRRGRWWRCSY